MTDQGQRWVKYPGPGQFRGEGLWYKLESFEGSPTFCRFNYTGGFPSLTNWFEWLVQTKYLPTHVGARPE